MDWLALFPLVLLLILFCVILMAVFDLRQYGFVAGFVCTICVITFMFFYMFNPSSLSFVGDAIESINFDEKATSLDIPPEYQGDWIGFNQTQNKTVSYHFIMSEDYSQRLQMFSFNDLPTVDIYVWNESLSKLQKSTEAYPFNYTLTVSKGNHSALLYNVYERLMTNQSMDFDASSLPWLFPIYNNDTVNLTVTLNTHNLPLSRDMVFLIPMHTHTIIIDNTPPEPKPTDETPIDWWTFIPLVVSISSCVCVVVINFFYRRDVRRHREREVSELLGRRYSREVHEIVERTRPTSSTVCSSREYGFSLPKKYADYHYEVKVKRENLENNIDQLRSEGYWTKVVNISSTESVIYISNWMQNEVAMKGIPEWRRIRPT